MNLTQRSEQLEIMDDLDISGSVIDQTLKELDIINRRLGGNHISLKIFKQLIRKHQIYTLADLGCGGADILKAMAGIAKKANQNIHFTGIDANPHIVEYASKNVKQWPEIQVSCEDILTDDFRRKNYDVIHCCLFLHHFTEQQLVELFRGFHKQTNVAIIVNDLHRHFLAYHSIKLLTRFFSRSYMVRNDAAISVARGFKKLELKSILHQAGITNYSLKWRWAFRWELVIYK